MKIQSLAIIFIIIILPISLVLSSYTKTRIETLNIQADYDIKLDSATFDALKAYQVNSFQNKTGNFTNSKIRDIKASVNTFFTSMSANFTTLGYTKESLQNYVPAIVYTMYDGYYVYTPFENTWDTKSGVVNSDQDLSDEMTEQIKPDEQTKYKEYSQQSSATTTNETIFGLKPYVYYSCRYRNSSGSIDVVITYALDNYVQIQGTIKENGQDKHISWYGYILNNVTENGTDSVTYEGVNIRREGGVVETVYYANDNGETESLTAPCIKRGGTKYYLNNGDLYYIFNNKLVKETVGGVPNSSITAISQDENVNDLSANDASNNNNAVKYYKEANNLKNLITSYGLDELTINDIVDEDTSARNVRYGDEQKQNPYTVLSNGGRIFDFNNAKGIESEDSNFNEHRRDVIKKSIEKNLSTVIANFDSSADTEFRLPKLKDTDWDKIINNIGIITFMQGVNIGGKIYNGYSIVANTENEDLATYDSIYIKTGSGTGAECHRITESNLANNIGADAVGIYNVNIERRSVDDSNAIDGKYYFPVYAKLSYGSLVTQNNLDASFASGRMTIKQYVNNLVQAGGQSKELARIFYTALGRERYGIYRPTLKID